MAFTDTKAREAIEFQNRLELEKRLERERREVDDETNTETKKWMEENGLKTNDDCRKFVMSEIRGRLDKSLQFRDNDRITRPKNICKNCGGHILRQRDMTNNEELIWLDEYQCVKCNLIQIPLQK